MLSHASKGHNLILMISYICRVILNCTMTSCCSVMTLSISLCYSSVVNKHQLLALSVLCLYCGINNGSRANIRILVEYWSALVKYWWNRGYMVELAKNYERF